MKHHRAQAFSLVVQRTLYFWFPRTARPLQNVLLSLLSLLALAGLVVLVRDYPTAGLLLALTWASFPVVYYVIQSAVRYRYPMTWTLLLAAAALLPMRSQQSAIPGVLRSDNPPLPPP